MMKMRIPVQCCSMGWDSNQKEISITIASQRHTLKGILARESFDRIL